MNQIILEDIKNFSLDTYRPIFPRELEIGKPLPPRAGNLVTIITGMRRSGKTYRLFQEMERLITSGVNPGHILYFNFEDTRLDPVTPKTGDQVLESFYALYPEAAHEGAYFFFDELQEMEHWGKWLRRIIDTHKATIFVSGSSSKMLSSEFSSELRGRTLEYVQYPFSFREFVTFHFPTIDVDSLAYSAIDRAQLQGAFKTYLMQGGFPAVQQLDVNRYVSVLQGYVQRVVARDVLERHNIGNPRGVIAFARKIMQLCGRMLSIRKSENELKSQGFSIGRSFLSDVLGYFEEAFLVQIVRERTRTVSASSTGMVKAYPIDPGLSRANASASTVDEGQALEDAVCIELLRSLSVTRDSAISYGKTREHGYEIDFVVGDALFDDSLELYQVTQNLSNNATRKRECRALIEAMSEYDTHHATIILGDGEDETIETDSGIIACIPAWRWFLQKK